MRGTKLVAIGLCVVVAAVAASASQAGGKRIITRGTTSNLPFSAAVVAGDFVYLSGTLSTRGDIAEQTRAVLDRLAGVLERAGSSLDRAAAVTVYLRHASDFQAMNEVFRSYWSTDPPTRTTVQANLVRPDALVEMSMVAIRNGAERRVILPDGWSPPASPYSYAIKSGGTVFLAGIVGRNYRAGTAVEGGIQAETSAIFDNARQILATAGLSLADIVAARLFMPDTGMFREMNETYREQVPDIPPARATVRASLMGTRYHLEVAFVAVKGERERIVRPNVDGSPGRTSAILSHAVRVGNRLYVSGMTGAGEATRGDARAQAREALAGIGRTLSAAGFGWEDVVDGIVYLTDMRNYAAMNEAYRAVLAKDFPARAAVEAGLMNPDALVEIMFTAVR